MLTSDILNTLLKQDTKTIRIDLKTQLNDPLAFEKEVSEFARKRNGEKLDNPATKEIESLVKKLEFIEEDLNQIDNVGAQIELKLLIKGIKELKYEENDETIGWRDKFIHYTQRAIELIVNNLKGHDFLDLQFEFGLYLHQQRQYNLVENYYIKLLEVFRRLAKDNPSAYIGNVATILNNLAILHAMLNRPLKSEKEFEEALDILRELKKNDSNKHLDDIAMIFNNLGLLYVNLNRYDKAEEEYKEALTIRLEQAKDNSDTHICQLANTINNLANLHSDLNSPDEAEKEYQKALEIRRELAKDNSNALCGIHMKALFSFVSN